MKRDEALRPLSREHLKALQAAKALREGEDLEAMTEAFLGFWESEGQQHFRLEEDLHDHVRFEERRFFPMVEEALDAAGLDELAARLG